MPAVPQVEAGNGCPRVTGLCFRLERNAITTAVTLASAWSGSQQAGGVASLKEREHHSRLPVGRLPHPPPIQNSGSAGRRLPWFRIAA
jgi:hypothetical protein